MGLSPGRHPADPPLVLLGPRGHTSKERGLAMAKRLNPKRRAEMRARYDAIARNPSELTTEGEMRSVYDSKTWKRPKGSSDGLARGLLYYELGVVTYVKPKRRKAVAKAVHVNPADLADLHRPVKEPVGAEYPKPKPQRRAGGKIVVVSKKPWANS